jgi:hypothetical protein
MPDLAVQLFDILVIKKFKMVLFIISWLSKIIIMQTFSLF